MATVYDVIDKIRGEKGLSTRKLAQMAKLPPTTLESMMTRQPTWVSVAKLEMLAHALGLAWTDFFEPGRENHVIGTTIPKASSYVEDGQITEIVVRALEKTGRGFSFYFDFRGVQEKKEVDDEELFRQSTTAILARLNSEGLMEAMRYLLKIAADPNYQKKKDGDEIL